MLHDVAAGMMYLHSRQFVHGDLRSPNLFVARDGKVCRLFFVDFLCVFFEFACWSIKKGRAELVVIIKTQKHTTKP